MLSSEKKFIKKHSSSLEEEEKTLLGSIDVSEPSSREGSVTKDSFTERTQYMRRIAELEQELSKREKDIRYLSKYIHFYF